MLIDKFITAFDTGLRTVLTKASQNRVRPDSDIAEAHLSDAEKKEAIALMRINHVGEVCAQALYSGQAFASNNPSIVASLKQAAAEETDHLAWCESRINELGGRKSLLNPLWYISSFTLGAGAGVLGDKWNLGFLAETEQQVETHLGSHLDKVSTQDVKTRTIIEQMQIDEHAHAQTARDLGASPLPAPIKFGMKFASKIMTTTAHYI
jgi:3-demethoxyubiquinol 3-hydroxylase